MAILVGMAERGEIDPWRIDIVEVTDRFLSELENKEDPGPPDLGSYSLLRGAPAPDEVGVPA